MDTISTTSRAKGFAEVNPVILEETPRTRIVFKAGMHQNGIRGDIIRYRKDSNGICKDIVPVDFNCLHKDDGIKIELTTAAIKALCETVGRLDAIRKKRGIQYGSHDFTVVDSDAIVINDQNKANVIRQLLEAGYGEEIWNELAQRDSDITSRLANAKIHEDRLKTLHQFEKTVINNNLSESDWQHFFEDNTWIFGYGLKYQVLNIIQSQPNYGGVTVTGTGGQRGDFLTATEAETKFTCLVEIKKPTTELLQHTQYRNGAWGVSSELAGAVSQIQVNCAQWEISSKLDPNRENLKDVITIAPRGIVVIGNTSELDDWNKKNSFERFRREIRNPEIITYDELLERARFIVTGSEK